MTTITITDADLAALVTQLTATVEKIGEAADALTTAIPLLQADVKEIADAAKTFKFSGPMGLHGGST